MTTEQRIADLEATLAEVNSRLQNALQPMAPLEVKVTREPNFGVLDSLPAWSGKGSVVEFLTKFEQLARIGGIEEAQWRTVLEWKLEGTALRVVRALAVDTTWEALKATLRIRYVTEESPQQRLRKFLDLTQAPQETAVEFLERLQEAIEGTNWEATGITLLGRFQEGLTGEPGRQTRVAAPETTEAALQIAQRWEKEAATAKGWAQPPPKETDMGPWEGSRRLAGRGKSTPFAIRCYTCGKEGHTSRWCELGALSPKKEAPPSPPTKTAPKEGFPARVCFRCRRPGHFLRDCPHPASVHAVAMKEANTPSLGHPKD